MDAGFAKHDGQENQHINNGAALFVPVTSHAITASLANSATGHNKDENVIAFDAYNQAETDEVSKTVAARNDQDTASCVAYAIQAGALRTNPNSGPDGVGVQADHAYTLEARSEVQAVVAEYYSHDYCGDRIYSTQGISPALNCTQRHKVRAFSIMPMNSGKDYKGRETDVAQPLMAAGPSTGAQGGDFIVSFAQNTRDGEVQRGPGAEVGALAAQPGMKQTNYIATFSDDGSARTLTARHDSSPRVDRGPDVVAFERQRGATQNLETTTEFSPALIKSQTPAVFVDVYNGAITGDVSSTVGASGSPMNSAGPQVLTDRAFGVSESPDLGHCLRSGASRADKHESTTYVATSAVRRLTPTECERLQGFPDQFTAIPWRKKGAEDCPDGPRYKALGNSMAVPVMRWIGERIQVIDDFVSLI